MLPLVDRFPHLHLGFQGIDKVNLLSANLFSAVPLALTKLNLWCRGEKTASAMENQLTQLEAKIDDLLASAEEQSQDTAAQMLSGKQDEVGDKVGS